MTPQDVRFGEIVNFIITRRAAGKSEDEIFVDLTAPRGLNRLHPCADSNGRNICARSEIDFALSESHRIAIEQEKQHEAQRKRSAAAGRPEGAGRGDAGPSIISIRNIIIAGGAIALLMAIGKKK